MLDLLNHQNRGSLSGMLVTGVDGQVEGYMKAATMSYKKASDLPTRVLFASCELRSMHEAEFATALSFSTLCPSPSPQSHMMFVGPISMRRVQGDEVWASYTGTARPRTCNLVLYNRYWLFPITRSSSQAPLVGHPVLTATSCPWVHPHFLPTLSWGFTLPDAESRCYDLQVRWTRPEPSERSTLVEAGIERVVRRSPPPL